MADVFTTKQAYDGETWSQFATRAYGDANMLRKLIEANPGIGMTDRLEGGTVLVVPVIDGQPQTTNENLLPPWKR